MAASVDVFIEAVIRGSALIAKTVYLQLSERAPREWRYSAIVFTGAAIVFFLHHFVQGIPVGVMVVLDAAGLALFAVAGTQKALIYKMHPFIAILLGTITGVGGGTIRDIFLARVPTVLRADVYATAAMARSAAMMRKPAPDGSRLT